MNVYDFDKTIFYPDSMQQFVSYCIKRHPQLLFSYVPKLIKAGIAYAFKKCSILRLHAVLNSVTRYLDNPAKDIDDYWKKYEKDISKWYLDQKKSDDLIISASPEYLLKPLTDKLGINLIGTIVDMESGVIIGNVRIAREKAKYIIEQDMPIIDNFYSDSLSDTPIALLAERAFIVTNKAKTCEPWPHLNSEITKEINKKINL